MVEQQQQTTEQPKVPQPTPGDEPEFQDEDIDVPLEDGEKPPETPETPEAPREKKRRGPKRYAALTHERDEARGYADRVAQENAELRARAEAAEAKAQESSKVAMQTFARSAESELKQAKAEYQAALDSGDNARITEANVELSKATQAVEDVKAYQETEKARPAPAAPPAPQPQRQEFQEPYSQPIKEWVTREENRYWDQHARDDAGNVVLDRAGRPMLNPDFNKRMHVQATMYATLLEDKIAEGEVGFKTGSSEYFRDIDKHMRETFPKYFADHQYEDDEEEAPAPALRRASPVAAPSRSAMPSSNQQSANKVRLSADQIRFVQKQVDNGGGPKYPQGHPKAFKPMTFEDAKVSFARRLQTQAKEQQ